SAAEAASGPGRTCSLERQPPRRTKGMARNDRARMETSGRVTNAKYRGTPKPTVPKPGEPRRRGSLLCLLAGSGPKRERAGAPHRRPAPLGTAYGIRTRVTAVRGRRPRPLD